MKEKIKALLASYVGKQKKIHEQIRQNQKAGDDDLESLHMSMLSAIDDVIHKLKEIVKEEK